MTARSKEPLGRSTCARPFAGPPFARRQGLRPLAFLLVLSALCWPCHGAQIVSLEGPWLAACLTARQTTLLRDGPGQTLERRPLRRVFDCLAMGPDRSLLGFRGCEAVRLGPDGGEQRVWALPDAVRCCLRLDDEAYLLLLGGRWESGQLRRARAALWRPGHGACSYSRQVLAAWNPFELAAGAAGAGEQQVLVAVRKTAPFDTVFRRRPFLFGFQAGAADLVPLWKGTSVAHPHLAATIAHPGPGLGPQLCALEQLRDGRRMLGAYGFSGRMQLVGASAPAALGERLEVLRGGAGAADMLVCAQGAKAQWRAVAYGGNPGGADGVYRLQPRLQTARWPAPPIAWNVLRAGRGPGVLALSPNGALVFEALTAP